VPVNDEPFDPLAVSQEPLPIADPVDFLQKCLERYEQQRIKGYHAFMRKQERIDGKLQPSEDVEVYFREEPHSVLMDWRSGERRAKTALYVEGENDGKALIRPAGVGGLFVRVVSRDPEGDDARQAGRYTLKQFGLKKGTRRTLESWRAGKASGESQFEYLGVRKVREAGDRLCYTLRRTSSKPVEDGITQTTVYIDKENWLQIGSVLKDSDGRLIGEYIFRDIQLNPEFRPNQFQRSIMKP
jgi:hypothetical protein